jgi:formamidopyrimidine-DNA glycosylase
VPELPEVETVRRGLAPALEGRTIERVEILDERLTRPFPPAQVAARLVGERVETVERRGKYLIVRFESGRVLLIHLRMTGNVLLGVQGAPAELLHRRAVVELDGGAKITYRDVRRFGTWLLLEPGELDDYLSERLGPEPLERWFSPRQLAQRFTGRRAPVKAVVLDQRVVAGLGNIYADEALWYARVHPLRPAEQLSADEVTAVHKGIRRALRTGIARQGATLSNYVSPDGERGSMQDEFRVYGRDGESCERCGTPIEKTRAGGRGTWYCPHCQV